MYHSDKSFETEIFSHKEALMGRARHLTRNDRDAEDLVQDTLLKACRNSDKYEPGTNCCAWLFRIMKNEYISQYRHNRHEIESLDRDEELDENSPDMRDAYIDDSEYCENSSDFGDEVTSALSNIPEDFRAIVVMADLQDQSYREISEKLSIPIGTVMSRLSRSRQLLRNILHDYALSLGIIKA